MPPITKLSYPRPFEPTKRGQHWYLEADGEELKLSNLTKIFYQEMGYTKVDLLNAYYNLAPFIDKETAFNLFRKEEGNFYTYVFKIAKSMIMGDGR